MEAQQRIYLKKRPHVYFKMMLLVLALYCSSLSNGSDLSPEKWTLSFNSNLNGSLMGTSGSVNVGVEASGTIDLIANKEGRFMGTGTVSVIMTLSMPAVPTFQFNPHKGQGKITVTGKRDGNNLSFGIGQSRVVCKGTITIKLPTGDQTQPSELTFDPSVLTPGESAIIERKNGSTTTLRIGGNVASSQFKGTATFTITGGTNIQREPEKPKGLFPPDPNLWTLEVEISGIQKILTADIAGTSQITYKGKAEFPMPLGDGLAKGEGPYTIETKTNWIKPISAQSTSSGKGTIVIEGEIKDDTLIFVPKYKLETFDTKSSPPHSAFAQNFGQGLGFFDFTHPISIPVKDGAEERVNHSFTSGPSTYNGHSVWRLEGKKRELWRITFDGYDKHWTGDESDALGGLRVQSRMVIDVQIEDDKYKSGSVKCTLVSIEPYSYPEGVYQSKSISVPFKTEIMSTLKTPAVNKPSFPVAAGKKSGNTLVLDLYYPKGDGIYYAVAYECTLDEKVAAKKLSNWDFLKNILRKKFTDYETWNFPSQLSVTLIDGWKKENGRPEHINYDVITVKRLK